MSDSTTAAARETADKAVSATKDAAADVTAAAQDLASDAKSTAKAATADAKAAVKDATADTKAAVKDATADTKAAVKDATKETKAAVADAKAETKAAVADATKDTKAAVADAKAAATGEPAPKPQRSVAEIQAELDATRERLATRIDDLQEYVTPKNVVGRQVDKVKGVFVDEFGGIKPDRVLIAAGVVVGVVVLLGVSRRRRSS